MKPNLLFTTLLSGTLLFGAAGFTACAKVALISGVNDNTITASNNLITKSVNIGNFKSVTVSGIASVVYTQQSATGVAKIEAPDNIMKYVSVETNGNSLTVTLKNSPNIHMNNQRIVCYVNSPELSEVKVSGTGDFNCTTLNTDQLTLNVSGTGDISFTTLNCSTSVTATVGGTGDIDIKSLECAALSASVGGTGDIEIDNLQATQVNASVGGTGDLELSGRVTNAEFSAGGTGDIKARKLVADNVVAHAGGTGDIECYASKSINASASEIASVTYWGSPSSVQTGKNVKSR